MKKLRYFFSLFLLATVGMSAQAASWVLGNELTSVPTAGQQIVLAYAGQTNNLLCGDTKSESVTDGCVYVLESVNGNADGYPLYVLKQVSTGLYLKDQNNLTEGEDSSDNPPHGNPYNPPFIEYTNDVTLAYTFTCLASELDSENPRTTVMSDKGPGLVENAWVLCCAGLKDNYHYYLGSIDAPFLSPYSDTNQWVFYSVEEAQGKDLLNQVMAELFPNGITSTLYPVGTNPGEFTQAAYDKAAAAYRACEDLISAGGNPSVEECNTLADNLRSAREELLASAVPVTPGYYWILGGPASDRGVYDAKGGLKYTGSFTIETEAEPAQSKAAYIWQVVDAGEGKFYLRNYSTSMYVGTVAANSTMIPVTSAAQETYTFQPSVNTSKGGLFDIINTTRGTGVSFNTDPTGIVVFWATGSGDNSYFKVVPVAAEVVDGLADLLAQERLNNELRGVYNTAHASYMKGRKYFVDGEEVENGSYDTPGLVLSEEQLSSNALQESPADGQGYAGLLDDDFTTYFHSRWGGDAVNEYHYLQVDLEKEYQALILKMSQRSQNINNGNPTEFQIYATNDLNGEWVFEGAYTVDWKYSTMVGEEEKAKFTGIAAIEMSRPYRYIRFTVTATTLNQKFGNYPFFYLSKFTAYEAAYDAAASSYERVDQAVRAEFEKQLSAAAAELAAGNATEATIVALRSAYDAFLAQFPDPVRLNELLAEAKALYEAAPEGTEMGYFPAASKAEFNTTIQAVEATVSDNMALADIKDGEAKITAALDKFNATLIMPAVNTMYVVRSITESEDNAAAANSLLYAQSNAQGANVKWGEQSDVATHPDYLWYAETIEGTTLTLRNVGTGLYMASQDKRNGAVTVSTEPVQLSLRSARTPGGFNIVVNEGLYANVQAGTGNVVAWDAANGKDNSAFKLEATNLSSDGTTYREVYGGWQAFCFPYDLVNLFDGSIGDAFEVVGEKVEDGKSVLVLRYIEDDVIPAGTPFIYQTVEGAIEDGKSTVEETFQLSSGNDIPEYTLEGKTVNGLVGVITGLTTGQNNIGVFQLITGMTPRWQFLVKENLSGSSTFTIPANSAYLNGTHPKNVTEAGDAYIELGGALTGIEKAEIVKNENVDVYSVSGVRVRANVKAADAKAGLPAGLYIIGGKKVQVK